MEPEIREHRGPRYSTRVRLALVAVLSVVVTLGAVGLGVATAPGPADATVVRVSQQSPGASSSTTTAAGAAATRVPAITGNSVIVVQQDPGQVSVIDGGRPRLIAGGLAKPNGAAVLPDGGIVVADSGNNRLVGIGGSFGSSIKEIVKVPFPEGVGVGSDGSVYVTLLLAGEVGKVDLQAGTYTKIAGDLKGPADVAERDGKLYVTESTGGDVVELTTSGQKSVVASGFQQPIGIVAGPGKSLYVADFKANKIVKVDDAGKSTDFVKLDAPVQLASAPFVLTADLPAFALVVTAKDGLVIFDNTAKKVNTIAIQQATGVATGNVTGAATPSSTTTIATPPESSPITSPGSAEVNPTTPGTANTGTSLVITPRTTRPRTTTTLATLDDSPASSNGNILLFSLGVIVLTIIALVMVFFVRRPKTMKKSGFEERPLDADSVADAFGPCAAEEVEVAEAEGARDAVIVQREASEKRQADAIDRVARTKVRLADAKAMRIRIENERKDAQKNGPPSKDELGSTEIKPEELGLTTDAGREALASFATGDLDAHELEERWRDLGEQQAIGVVREVGERRARLDPSKPWPDELRAIDAEARAEADLTESEHDIEFAEAEIQRLHEREAEVVERISAAHQALDECQDRHRDAQRAKASTAKAEARAAQAAADEGAGASAPAAGAGASGDGDGPDPDAPESGAAGPEPTDPKPVGPKPGRGPAGSNSPDRESPDPESADPESADHESADHDSAGPGSSGPDSSVADASQPKRSKPEAFKPETSGEDPPTAVASTVAAPPSDDAATAPESSAVTGASAPHDATSADVVPAGADSAAPEARANARSDVAPEPAAATDSSAAQDESKATAVRPLPPRVPAAPPASPAADTTPSEVVGDKPRIWGSRQAKPAATPAPEPSARASSTPPLPAAQVAPEMPAAAPPSELMPDSPLGTREEMLALIEAAKQSKREASERRAATMNPKPADDDTTSDG